MTQAEAFLFKAGLFIIALEELGVPGLVVSRGEFAEDVSPDAMERMD